MPAVSSTPRSEHYRGKNLLFLLLAMVAPAGLLYLRLVFSEIATQGEPSPSLVGWLAVGSNVALGLFFLVQFVAARYVQHLLKPARSFAGTALQYVAVLLLCLIMSIIGAVLLEGFGYYAFLRVRTAHGLR